MSRPGEFVAGDVLAASEINALPGGVYGYAERTSSQTGITSITDLTGLSVTVILPASRRIKISAQVRTQQQTSGGRIIGQIQESTTVLGTFADDGNVAAAIRVLASGSAVITPSSGSHTYKLTLSTSGGSVDAIAGATSPNFIVVEDLGAV